MSRFLTILEVSQKQAYIFSSNKLKDNIRCSSEIAYITGIDYMQEALDARKDTEQSISLAEHLVYSGGGHIIFEFAGKEDADAVVECITVRILEDLPDIEMFAATVPYDDAKTPGENIKDLTKALESKKSFRAASFHQGSFGIEKIDSNTGKPVLKNKTGLNMSDDDYRAPDGFIPAKEFEDMGGEKGENSFIAVVHIDGNAMGKRVEEIAASCKVGEWDEYKRKMRSFSEGIKTDFDAAYREMEKQIAAAVVESYWLNFGKLTGVSFKRRGNNIIFPVRKIISEGDDICFVSEGRIGIACAVAFLNALREQINQEDEKPYAACAGVAIVHQKYPFYRAYELAEELCSNAKRFGVTLGTKAQVAGKEQGVEIGAQASCIDWHVEFGEVQDTLEETRTQYENRDGARLELRPYMVSGPEELVEKEPIRQYKNFEKLIAQLLWSEDNYSSGSLKQLRGVLKKGSEATDEYLKFHKMESLRRDVYLNIYKEINYAGALTGKAQEGKLFETTVDGKCRSLIFDAIEMMDTYLPLEEVVQ